MQLPSRPSDSNKFTFGHVLNIAGSVNFRGAAYLSTVSALCVGAGYVTLAAIPPVIDAVAAQLPESVYLPLPQTGNTLSNEALPIIEAQLTPGVVCSLGCGISALANVNETLTELVEDILARIIQKRIPLVLDADGLNRLSLSQKKFRFAGLCVMTPHPKELSRLLKTDVETVQKNRIDAAREASKKFEAVVLLKGNRTVIANGNDFRINETGNSSLAKAGTGDCLTGIIAGLLAQKMSPFDAAILGAKLHGLAGELAAKELSEYGVLASDLPKYVAKAIASTRI